MGDDVTGNDWIREQGTDILVMKLRIEAAYLDAYAQWLALGQVEKQVYPMPQKPAIE